LSLANHHDNFVKGIIETQDVAYFVLFTLFCLFLTLRAIEATRWQAIWRNPSKHPPLVRGRRALWQAVNRAP
jgi:hypothetical protein